jgi:hypothetical protein
MKVRPQQDPETEKARMTWAQVAMATNDQIEEVLLQKHDGKPAVVASVKETWRPTRSGQDGTRIRAAKTTRVVPGGESTPAPDQSRAPANKGKDRAAAPSAEPSGINPAPQPDVSTPVGVQDHAAAIEPSSGSSATGPKSDNAPVSTEGQGLVASSPAAAPSGDDSVQAVYARFSRLCDTQFPDDPKTWAQTIWEGMYPFAPPEDGDFFAVPLRGEWENLASPASLVRINRCIDPALRIEVREGGPSSQKLVAVRFDGRGDPNVPLHIRSLLRVWSGVIRWYREVSSGANVYPLDAFVGTLDVWEDMKYIRAGME